MINSLKLILKQPFYALLALESSLGLLMAFWWVLRRQSTFVDFYAVTHGEPLYFWPFIILTLLTIVIFGILIALTVYSWNNSHLKIIKMSGSGGLFGAILGAIGSACPLCGAFFASSLGVAWSLGSLPLKGLELKAGSVVILSVVLYMTLKKVSGHSCKDCNIERKDIKRNYGLHFAIIVLMILFGANLLGGELEVLNGHALSARINELKNIPPEKDYALYEEIVGAVLPKNGVNTGIVPGDVFVKLTKAGIIDLNKIKTLYDRRGGLSKDQLALLTVGSGKSITVNAENANFLVNVFWGLGLANFTEFNKASPLNGETLFNFASTGGWTLGEAKNGGEYFNKFKIVELTPEQEAVAFEVAKNTYRPCCGNSTFFQDCNHGSALLGIIELGASQGMQEDELYKVGLAFNSFWFPDTYVKTALYMKVLENTNWKDVDARQIMSFDYSSAPGWQKNIASKISEIQDLIPAVKGGGGCGV